MSFFSSDVFLEALAGARYPGRKSSPVIVEVDGERFRLLKVGRRRFVTRAPFLDFHTPLTTGRPPDFRLPFLPRAEREIIDAARWDTVKRERPWMVSPLLDWTGFSDWECVQRHVATNRSRLFRDTERERRRLESRAGRIEIVLDADPEPLLGSCFAWKAEQCRETGLRNPLADPRNVALFEALARGGRLIVSALMVGGRPAAVHLGAVHEGRFLYWVPAYDRGLRQYAPGRVLLHFLLEDSFKSGHKSFEFLIGDEPYKFHYASHARLIAPLGRPPPLGRAWVRARTRLAAAIRHVPVLHSSVRALKQKADLQRDPQAEDVDEPPQTLAHPTPLALSETATKLGRPEAERSSNQSRSSTGITRRLPSG